MPNSVRNAVIALWITIAISAIAVLIDKLTGQITDDMFLLHLIIYALTCIIPYKISNGSNATRYVFLILLVYVIFAWIGSPEEMVKATPKWSLMASYIVTVIDALIIYWLFSSSSTQWFKKNKS